MDRINYQLDITYRCNASCINCSRHCNDSLINFDYDNSDLNEEDILFFINEAKKKQVTFKDLRILGGEPTLHPKLEWIIKKLKDQLDYKYLTIVTNEIKKVIYDGVRVKNYYKNKREYHVCMLAAPKDIGQKTLKCENPIRCGMTYNKYGFFPCGPGMAIIRLFGFNEYIKKEMPVSVEDFGDLSKLCSLCQYSAQNPLYTKKHGKKITQSFEKAIESYNKKHKINR